MKKLAVFAVAAVMAVAAFAQEATWMGNSLIVVNNGWYNGSKTVEGWNDFDGYDFGALTSLILGGEIQTYGETACADLPVQMNVKIDGSDDNTLTGSLGHDYYDEVLHNNIFKNETAVNVDVNQFEPWTEHTVTVYFSKQTSADPSSISEACGYNNGVIYGAGGDKTATFTAVPEPATMSLLGLGALAMVLRRKLRK